MEVRDQRSDPSRRVLVGIVRRLRDPQLARTALDVGMAERENGEKTASNVKTAFAWPEAGLFPLDTPGDVLLSRVYFAGQRDKIATEIADAIEERIGAREILVGVAPDAALKGREKNASCPVYELMPGVRATAEELEKAGANFEAAHGRMTYEDRLAFAQGFARAADTEKLAGLPGAVLVYAGRGLPADGAKVREHLTLRKAAARRRGRDGEPYARLAEGLRGISLEDAAPGDLRKLAALIRRMDEEQGLAAGKAARRLPDASRLVFTERTERERGKKDQGTLACPHLAELTREDLAARFGEGVLEEATNLDGTLNPRRVADLMELFGKA